MFKSLVVPLGLAVICAGTLIGYRPANAATATHSISQFGALTNAMMAYGSSANRSKVAGRTLVSSNHQAFVHSDGVLAPLGTLPGFTHSLAHDVNDNGQAVGWAGNSPALGSNFGERAFVYSGGTMTQLPALPGTGYTHAYAINNAGTVVGVSGSNKPYKFNIGDTALTQLAFPAGSAGGGRAHDINSAGDIVGFDYTTFPQQRPVFWDNGITPVGLALPAGANSAVADVINDAGVIAGTAFYGAGIGTRGFYYDANGTPVDMGTLGSGFLIHEVFDINSSYQAVGRAWNSAFGQGFSPFLYRDGTIVNLNSLLPAGSGWVLTRPISINDAGEIIGIGTFNGTQSGFKLTPVPEPAALAGLAIMTVATALRRGRHRARKHVA